MAHYPNPHVKRMMGLSRVGRALQLLAAPAPTFRYPSVVDTMTEKQVTAEFARMMVRNAPWGEQA